MKNGYALCLNEWAIDKTIKSELGLLLIVSSLTAENGYCYASNSYFSKLFEINEVSVSRKLKKLIKKGYISISYEKRGAEVIKREIRLTKMLTDGLQKDQSTINKNVKENNTSNNNIYINQKSNKKDQKFSFNLSQKTQYENLSQEYKDQLQKEIESLNGNLSYDDFILSLEAKGYQYKNFLSAYKQWNKNAKPTQQKQTQNRSQNANAFAMKEQRQQRQFISDNLISKLNAQGIGRSDFAKWYNDPSSAPKGIAVVKENGKFVLVPTNEPQDDDNIIDTEVL